jgi:hypothetical protein
MKIKIEDSSEDGAAQDLAKEVWYMFCIFAMPIGYA